MDQSSKDQDQFANAEDPESNYDGSREDPPSPPPVDTVQTIVRDPPDSDS